MAFIYMTWAVYVAGLIYLPLRGDYGLGLVWAAALPTALWGYVRAFPWISQYLGYGRVEDVCASQLERRSAKVTMYGSAACPFCPIVRRRLHALREKMGFDLEYVDVTAKPGILTSKGIKAAPVVEVGGRRIVGHVTSEQISELVSGG
jgi:glutaredoxin